MYNMDLEKAEETEIKLPTWIIEKAKEFQKDIYYCFIDYAKSFDCVDNTKLWKVLQKMGIPDHLLASWDIYVQVKMQQLEPDMEQQTGSK